VTLREPAAPDAGVQARYSLIELAETIPGVISLGRGDPDLDTPEPILDRALLRARRERPSRDPRGLKALRDGIARRYRARKSLVIDADSEVLVTNGVQEGLFISMLAIVNPGDRVLIADPRYTSYDQAVNAACGVIVEVPTRPPDFTMNPEDIAARAAGASALVLVNPNNPTSAFVPDERVLETARVAKDKNLWVFSDEIYENLVFDGRRVLSVATVDGMRERTITLSGFSKTYAMTGFRVGYLIGPAAFIDAATRLKHAISGPAPHFSQTAALGALELGEVSGDAGEDAIPRGLLATFDRRRTVMMRGLDALRIPYGYPGGGFYVWADVSRFGLSAAVFCRRLLVEGRVLMFPGSAFGEKWSSWARISLLQPEDKLEEALRRVERWIQTL
jgi:aspartate/methionine/tyrosine aminotransferase